MRTRLRRALLFACGLRPADGRRAWVWSVFEDFSSLVVDGKAERLGGQDKGHRALLAAFRAAVAGGGDSAVTLDALATSRTTLEALAGLGEGGGGSFPVTGSV